MNPLLLAVFLIFAFPPLIHSAFSEGFTMIKVDSHYEPEMYEWIQIPGTNMKAGLFSYVLNEKEGEYDSTIKAGVLVNGKTLYYVESGRFEHASDPARRIYVAEFDSGGDVFFGIYKNYLAMDSCSYAASSCNRMMFLFRFGKNTVELLDAISRNLNLGDFKSEYVRSVKQGAVIPAWTDVKDFDGDGNPEVKLIIYRAHHTNPDFDLLTFELYLEIKNSRLIVDFNPMLYKPLFKKERRKKWPKGRPDAYYVYGFLAGELKMKKIKTILKSDGEIYEGQYGELVPLLEDCKNWDAEFHEAYYSEKPVLMKYEIRR